MWNRIQDLVEEHWFYTNKLPDTVFMTKEDYLEFQLELNQRYKGLTETIENIAFEAVTIYGVKLTIRKVDIPESVVAITIKLNK